MRVVVQRVSEAFVKVNNVVTGQIKQGLLVLAGFENADTLEDIQWICNKLCGLRIFNDEAGVMNLNVNDIQGDILLISQFTLHASTKKGNRPSYIKAAKADVAILLYQQLLEGLENTLGKKIATGIFGADMIVSLINDGPVTIVVDTRDKQ